MRKKGNKWRNAEWVDRKGVTVMDTTIYNLQYKKSARTTYEFKYFNGLSGSGTLIQNKPWRNSSTI
jgi:hypothetical protein